jgi:GH43 family beta-xylosidase
VLNHCVAHSPRPALPLRHSSTLSTLLLASALTAPFEPAWAESTFTNPILQAPAQDPQVTWIDGQYYYCESTAAGIFLRVADDFSRFAESHRICVWAPPRRGPMARHIWAPELHVIGGRCYIYFAADDGDNANHRMWVLASKTGDVLGQYELMGSLDTEGWAIDGTVFTDDRGELYFLWSGWPGAVDGQQNLYISRMADPLTLVGGRVLISAPDQIWERHGLPLCEGPQVLRRNGRTFIVYSASASWTQDYCLGLMVHEGGDLMDPANWRKVGRVFGHNEHAWGLGHCGFLTTPDGAEDWIFYHAKTSRAQGWKDREVRAQPFTWNAEGWPELGEPLALDQRLPRPAQTAIAKTPRLPLPAEVAVR